MTNSSQPTHEKPKPTWKHVHPMLSEYTYRNLDEPASVSEAHMRMVMHRNAVEDIEIQLKVAETHHSLYLLDGQELQEEHDKYLSKAKKHFQKVVALLNSMLLHKRKAAAYWYWLQCAEFEEFNVSENSSHDTTN